MPGSVIPPPLVRGGQQASSKLGPQASSQVVMPPLVRGAQVSRVCTYGTGAHPAAPSSHHLTRMTLPGPPNPLVLGVCGAHPFPVPLSIIPLIVLSPTLPYPDSKSTTSDNIPARGHPRSSWPPGHPCLVCKFRDRGSSSRASSASPTSPTPVCSSTSHR